MVVFQHLVKLLSHSEIRTIIQSSNFKLPEDPFPFKIAFESYEAIKKETTEIPPLLVHHGLLGSKTNWHTTCKYLQENLKPNRRIIAVDARNHGESPHADEHSYPAMASDVKALLTKERIPKVVCLGHSMGGKALMYLSLIFPQLVEQLIVVDISPVSESKNSMETLNFIRMMASIQIPPKSSLSSARSFVNKAMTSTVKDKYIRDFLLTNLVQKSDGTIGWKVNLEALIKNFPNIYKFPIKIDSGMTYLGRTTFIAGLKSDHLKTTDFDEIKKLFPNARFVTVKGVGHWIHSENPTVFNRIILNVLK